MAKVLAFILALLLGGTASAREIVKVGGYEFGPFVDLDATGKPGGLTFALIDALNHYQDRFSFQFVLTSPNRRYKDFEDHKFDVIFFESPDWGWTEKKLPVDASQVFLNGGERYIALARPGRDQDYFNRQADKRMVGILGYHYGFTGYESDPAVLAKTFHMILVTDNAASIEMILKDRGDIAVVTDSYLARYLKSHPGTADKLLVSERFDQHYAHRILVRRDIALTVADIDRLLAAMTKDHTLSRLWHDFGITD